MLNHPVFQNSMFEGITYKKYTYVHYLIRVVLQGRTVLRERPDVLGLHPQLLFRGAEPDEDAKRA